MTEQRPGLHSSISERIANFPNEERRIIYKLSQEWYVTNAGEFSIGQSSRYRYALVKATSTYREMFGFEREIIVIFSPYELFQARSIDAIDTLAQSVLDKYQALRIERICSILFSKDPNIERKISDILRESQAQDSQVIVPIPYNEILESQDDYFLRNKFRSNFYKRDLFDFTSPLKKDLYFFGRTDLINKLGDRHFSHENSGVFGLRRSGKTSLIFAVQRQMDRVGYPSVLISCDDVTFQQYRWNECLYYILEKIVDKYKQQSGFKVSISPVEAYSERNASTIFEKDLLKIHGKLGKKPILIIFDEIERITFNTAIVEHWQTGADFIFFWQTLKSKFNTLENVFSYLIVGTNPTCIETSKILGKDNPIFQSVSIEYLERFDIHQTRDMVGKIGNFLGLSFEEMIYGKLVEDYGGHPFLIRQVCSLIFQKSRERLPIKVDRSMYLEAKSEFEQGKSVTYISMILEVLIDFYKDEHTMLTYLALGDTKLFNDLAKQSPEYVTHLIGYGIVSRNHGGDGYDFKIDAVQKYLQNRNLYKKLDLTLLEMRQEVSQRRNDLEIALRDVIRLKVLGRYGIDTARNLIWKQIKPKKKKFDELNYKDLFSPSEVNIYFSALKEIILKDWEIFEEIFKSEDYFKNSMQSINKYREIDAHAGTITNIEFTDFRANIEWLETRLSDWKKLTG